MDPPGDQKWLSQGSISLPRCVENLTPDYADFTLRPALAEFGEPLRFWIDRGQTQCYVQVCPAGERDGTHNQSKHKACAFLVKKTKIKN